MRAWPPGRVTHVQANRLGSEGKVGEEAAAGESQEWPLSTQTHTIMITRTQTFGVDQVTMVTLLSGT